MAVVASAEVTVGVALVVTVEVTVAFGVGGGHGAVSSAWDRSGRGGRCDGAGGARGESDGTACPKLIVDNLGHRR